MSAPNSNITDIVNDNPTQITLEQYEGIKRHFLASISDYAVGDISNFHASKFDLVLYIAFNTLCLISTVVWTDLHSSDDKRSIELAKMFRYV